MISEISAYLQEKEREILQADDLQRSVYIYLTNKFLHVNFPDFNVPTLMDEEKIANWGYLNLPEDKIEEAKSTLNSVLGKAAIKPGLHYSEKPILLAGIYLLALKIEDADAIEKLQKSIKDKINDLNGFDKFLLFASSGIHPETKNLVDIKSKNAETLLAIHALKCNIPALQNQDDEIADEIIKQLGHFISTSELGFREVFLLEYFLSQETKKKFVYNEHNARSIVRQILTNFHDSVAKIVRQRRENRIGFSINDEYDTQDLLFSMMKPIFPDIQTEDYTPKYGGSSKRIDLVLPSDDIVIEVKYVRNSDTDRKFVEELNTDISTYHKHPNTRTLFGFVYDPNHIISNHNFFDELNGKRIHDNVSYEVEIIVNPR